MLMVDCLNCQSVLPDERILRGSQGWGGLLLRFGLFLDLDQRLEPHLAMMIEAGAGRNNVTHDHVFLEALAGNPPGRASPLR